MDFKKLDEILQKKGRFDGWGDLAKEGHEYYYTIIIDEGIYWITTDRSDFDELPVYYKGYYISKIPLHRLKEVIEAYDWLMLNSKTYVEGLTEKEALAHIYLGSYSKEKTGEDLCIVKIR